MRKCRKCGRTARQHCAECAICSPRESEHPYWCSNASRYARAPVADAAREATASPYIGRHRD